MSTQLSSSPGEGEGDEENEWHLGYTISSICPEQPFPPHSHMQWKLQPCVNHSAINHYIHVAKWPNLYISHLSMTICSDKLSVPDLLRVFGYRS